MQNNPLFVDNSFINTGTDLMMYDENFINRVLYLKVRNGKLTDKTNGLNSQLKYFLKNKNAIRNYLNFIKFYENHFYENKDIILEILLKDIESVFKNGYVLSSKINKRNLKKIKKDIFFNYDDDESKIYIDFELIIVALTYLYNTFSDDEPIMFFLSILSSVKLLFLEQSTDNNRIIDGIQKYGKTSVKGELFYFTIYNKLFNLKLNLEEVKQKILLLEKQKYIKKYFGITYKVLVKVAYESKELAYLFLKNIIIFGETDEILFNGSIYKELFNDRKKEIEVLDKINYKGEISNNIENLLLSDFQIKFKRAFYETGNYNKKNIKVNKKTLENYNSKKKFILTKEKTFKSSLENYLENFFNFNSNIENCFTLLYPLNEKAHKFLSSNFYYTYDFGIEDEFIKFLDKYKQKHLGKYINIDDFILEMLEESGEIYIFFSKIRAYFKEEIGEKIEDSFTLDYLFSEIQIIKKLLIHLAGIGYFDLFGEKRNIELFYLSGSGYGWGYYSEKDIEVEVFEPKYIKFKEINFELNIPKDNHISGNDIYLSLASRENLIKNFAKFTKLEKLENYAIVNVSRDTLIKAKNEFSLTEEKIKKYFDDAKLKISKTLDILVSGTLNQKEDLKILPVGIPVIFENKGIFNEFKKLKMFNKYILYENDVLNLIIFDEKFRNLEKLLSSRKVVYKKDIKLVGK